MDRLNYLFGVSLPQNISKKLNNNYLFHAPTPEMKEPWYLKDAFRPDGRPATYDPDVIYPVYAPRYLRQLIPSSQLEVEPGYKERAAVAAIHWLDKLLLLPIVETRHFDGEVFTKEVNGTSFNFCFPLTTINYAQTVTAPAAATNISYSRAVAAILPFPDSRDNDDDWQGSVIPSYAESQARMLLWCWRQSRDELGRRNEVPTDCFIVRITGNTPSDVTVRTIHSDPDKEDVLAARLCKSVAKAKTAGTDLATNPLVNEQGTWFERKAKTVDEAYQANSKDLYDLVREYMTLTTIRKTKEAEANKIKEQEECIAISLASLTSDKAQRGIVEDPGEKLTYTVTHSKKGTRSATVSAALVRQFFPEYIDCIVTNEVPRGRITIEAN